MYKLLNVSGMLVFMNYYEQVFSDVKIVSDSMIGLSAEVSRLDGIFAAIENRKQKKYLKEIPDRNADKLRIENISFQYQSAYDKVLKDISVLINRNEKTAIVGKSGCGKSTFIKILLGLYEPDKGDLYLGDINLNKISPNERNKIVNAVLQDPLFLNITILENLKLAKSHAAMEEIDLACKMAYIFDFIQSMPEKYDTVIGERGVKLSGGQRQRLAIARVLLLNPQIIIFDEATSSLDSESESKVINSIEELAESRTIISVAHRYSTIAEYENVIVMQDGTVVLKGHLNELIENKELVSSIFLNA